VLEEREKAAQQSVVIAGTTRCGQPGCTSWEGTDGPALQRHESWPGNGWHTQTKGTGNKSTVLSVSVRVLKGRGDNEPGVVSLHSLPGVLGRNALRVFITRLMEQVQAAFSQSHVNKYVLEITAFLGPPIHCLYRRWNEREVLPFPPTPRDSHGRGRVRQCGAALTSPEVLFQPSQEPSYSHVLAQKDSRT
jgi:hypothetical protein